jgi:hypothetical protein
MGWFASGPLRIASSTLLRVCSRIPQPAAVAALSLICEQHRSHVEELAASGLEGPARFDLGHGPSRNVAHANPWVNVD